MKTIRLFGISIMSILMSISASSCSSSSSSDDDMGNLKATDVEMSYRISAIMEEWFDYIDFTLEYYKGNNQLVSENLTKDIMDYTTMGISAAYTWKSETIKEKIPAKLGIRIKMKLKEGADINKMKHFLQASLIPCEFGYSFEVRDASNSVIEIAKSYNNEFIYSQYLNKWESDPTLIFTRSYIFTFSEYATKEENNI